MNLIILASGAGLGKAGMKEFNGPLFTGFMDGCVECSEGNCRRRSVVGKTHSADSRKPRADGPNSASFSIGLTIWCMLSLQPAENYADLPFNRAIGYLSFDTFAVH
jgi:hypothetical protein